MLPTVRRTWAPQGHTPVYRHRMDSYQKVSGIGAISVSPQRRKLGLYLGLHSGKNITQKETIRSLRHLVRHIRRWIVLLWDRSPVHRGKQVQKFIASHRRFILEWLPAYAPDLNPVDYLWGYLKYHRMPNNGIAQINKLRDRVRRETNRLINAQNLLRAFIHATKLPLQLRH